MRSVIVARGTTPYVEFLAELPGGDILAIEAPGLAVPPGRLLRRSGDAFATVAMLAGVNAPAALSPDGKRLLAAGPLVAGEQASAVIVDLDAWHITRSLPVKRPFAWIDDHRFFAQSSSALVVVDLAADTTRPVLDTKPVDEETCIAISDRRDVVYTATHYSRISALRCGDGSLIWQRPAVRVVHEGMTYALAIDAQHGELVALGIGDHDLLRLDLATGVERGRDDITGRLPALGLPAANALHCVARRADGLVAIGCDRGVLVVRWPDGRCEPSKVGARAIQALAFVRGGTHLLIGGAERNLRLLPC